MEVGCSSIDVKIPTLQSAKQRHTLMRMHLHGCCHLLFPESYMFMYTLGNLPTMIPAACWCCSQMGNFAENALLAESDWLYLMPWVVF